MASTEGEPHIGEMVVVAIKEEPVMSDEMPLLQNDDPLAGTEHAPIPVKRLRRLPFGLGPHATGNRKIFTCEQCGYRTEYKGSMNRHKMRHSSSKSFACGLCSYRAYQAQSLKAHMMKHTNGEKTNTCDYPNEQRTWLDTNKITPNGQLPGKCILQNVEKTEDMCNPSDYLGEVEIIEGEDNKEELTRRPLVPSEDVSDDGDLKPKIEPADQEMLSEDHDLPNSAFDQGQTFHECYICDYRSPKISHLQYHMVSHSGEKPFACDICGYRTGISTNLTRHMKLHTDEKLFGCNICNYRTRQMSDVKKHKQIHSDERPYGCGVCDYRALYLTHLQAHMKREHGMN